MLTFTQILKRTPTPRVLAARFVRIVKLKTGHSRTTGRAYAACQSYSTHHLDAHGHAIRNKDKQQYVTVVEFLDNKLHVNVSCSCPDFTFTAEVALAQRGAADIEYSNGEAPDIRNPHRIPLCCKHLVALYNRIEPTIAIAKARAKAKG